MKVTPNLEKSFKLVEKDESGEVSKIYDKEPLFVRTYNESLARDLQQVINGQTTIEELESLYTSNPKEGLFLETSPHHRRINTLRHRSVKQEAHVIDQGELSITFKNLWKTIKDEYKNIGLSYSLILDITFTNHQEELNIFFGNNPDIYIASMFYRPEFTSFYKKSGIGNLSSDWVKDLAIRMNKGIVLESVPESRDFWRGEGFERYDGIPGVGGKYWYKWDNPELKRDNHNA